MITLFYVLVCFFLLTCCICLVVLVGFTIWVKNTFDSVRVIILKVLLHLKEAKSEGAGSLSAADRERSKEIYDRFHKYIKETKFN